MDRSDILKILEEIWEVLKKIVSKFWEFIKDINEGLEAGKECKPKKFNPYRDINYLEKPGLYEYKYPKRHKEHWNKRKF